MAARAYVFVGPTLAPAAAQEMAPNATILPPVAGGDLLRLAAEPGDLVAIIDGYFYQSAAVRHKEILWLMERGVEVLGAASIGALRAAELAPFGMRGYGRIFAAYTSGQIEGDDEVAVMHGPAEEGYAPLSEALVNIRYRCEIAVRAGIVTADTAARVVSAAAQMPFHQRTYRAIFERAVESGASEGEVTRLVEFMAHNPRDLKQKDARRLLSVVRGWRAGLAAAKRAPFLCHETCFLREWLEDNTGRDVAEVGFVPDHEVLTFCQLFGSDYPGFHYRSALESLAAAYSRERGLVVENGASRLAEFRRRYGLESDENLKTWLNARCLQLTELEACLEERSRVHALVNGRADPGAEHVPDKAALEELVAEYGVFRGFFRGREELSGNLRTWLTPDEDGTLTDSQKRARVAARTFWHFPAVPCRAPLIYRLKMNGVFPRALEGVAAARTVDGVVRSARPEFGVEQMSLRGLLRAFGDWWGLSGNGNQVLALRDRGFQSFEEFAARARPFYWYGRVQGSYSAFPIGVGGSEPRRPETDPAAL